MAAPTNISFLTATDLGLVFPADITQNVHDAGTTYTVYYKFTAPAGSKLVGALGFGDLTTYLPTITVYEGPASSPSQLLPGLLATAVNLPIQFPVIAGTLYLLKFTKNGANPSPAVLHLNVRIGQALQVSAGTIAVNDDTPSLPLILISAEDGTVINSINNFPAGEGGDVLSNGRVLVEDSDFNGVRLYDYTYETVLASIVTARRQPIRTNTAGDTFYCAYKGLGLSPATVTTINSSGVAGGTIWTLTGITGLSGLGASPDETILYYVGNDAATINDDALRCWDIISDVALPNLVGPVVNEIIGATRDSLLVLADGTILVAHANTSTSARYIKRYDPDTGAVLNTYSLGTDTIDRLFSALIPTHFMVWLQPDGITDIFKEIDADTGDIINSITSSEFESGVYTGSDSADPPRFGNSNSCPAWVVKRGIVVNNAKSGLYILTGTGGNSGGVSNPAIKHDVDWIDTSLGTSESVKIPDPYYDTFLAGDE